MRVIVALAAAAGVILSAASAKAEHTVADYIHDGWEIKTASQISANGYTQIILQKDNRAMICTIYYSVADNKWGWLPKGCDPMP
jgi:hypothetical protein